MSTCAQTNIISIARRLEGPLNGHKDKSTEHRWHRWALLRPTQFNVYPYSPSALEYHISVRGNVIQSHEQMCLDWPQKAPLALTPPIRADGLSKKYIFHLVKDENKNEYLHKGYILYMSDSTGTQISLCRGHGLFYVTACAVKVTVSFWSILTVTVHWNT